MFEDYLEDAYEFYNLGNIAAQEGNERVAKRYYRACSFYCLGAMEAFVNFVAETMKMTDRFDEYLIAFLCDQSIVFDYGKGKKIRKGEYHRLEDKIKVILRAYDPEFSFNEGYWARFQEFKDFRDKLVHPKLSVDEYSLDEYSRNLRFGLNGVVQTMNAISQSVFGKRLRQRLLDIDPENK